MSGSFDKDLFGHPARAKYPNAPGHRGVPTSIEAAAAIASQLGELQSLTLDFIIRQGAQGATSDECASGLDIDRLSIRPRTTELNRKGLIVDSGLRRRNVSRKWAIVWTLPQYKREVRSMIAPGAADIRHA